MRNSKKYFELVKDEWCRSIEQHKPLWNDFMMFAKLYHKEQLLLHNVVVSETELCEICKENIKIKTGELCKHKDCVRYR